MKCNNFGTLIPEIEPLKNINQVKRFVFKMSAFCHDAHMQSYAADLIVSLLQEQNKNFNNFSTVSFTMPITGLTLAQFQFNSSIQSTLQLFKLSFNKLHLSEIHIVKYGIKKTNRFNIL